MRIQQTFNRLADAFIQQIHQEIEADSTAEVQKAQHWKALSVKVIDGMMRRALWHFVENTSKYVRNWSYVVTADKAFEYCDVIVEILASATEVLLQRFHGQPIDTLKFPRIDELKSLTRRQAGANTRELYSFEQRMQLNQLNKVMQHYYVSVLTDFMLNFEDKSAATARFEGMFGLLEGITAAKSKEDVRSVQSKARTFKEELKKERNDFPVYDDKKCFPSLPYYGV